MNKCENEIKKFRDEKVWDNWHHSLNVGGDFQEFFQPNNGADTLGKPVQSEEVKKGLKALLDIVAHAAREEKSIRAYGSRWSLNNIAFSQEIMVHTWDLNYCRLGFLNGETTPTYDDKLDKLCFVQTGVMVKYLNELLASKDKVLPTTGASDGQRFVGAVATGTHGSANAFGSMQDYVKGIHLVIPQGRRQSTHVFIQRKSDKVVTPDFTRAVLDGPRMIYDDELFNAALVSFGTFGLIHGLLIEVEDMFELKIQGKPLVYNQDMRDFLVNPTSDQLKAFGFSWLSTSGDELPFSFNVGINAYRPEIQDKVFIQVMQKETGNLKFLRKGEAKIIPDLHESVSAEMEKQLKNTSSKAERSGLADLRRGIYAIGIQLSLIATNRIFETHNAPIVLNPPHVFTSNGSDDCSLAVPIPGTSTEIGVPVASINDALDLILGILWKHPIPAPVSLRYVPPSGASLAFTKYEDWTVTIELPGPDQYDPHWLFPNAARTHQRIFDALSESDIPHSYHWGQRFPINTDWVEKTFSPEVVEDWKVQRKKLLPNTAAQEIFSNELTRSIGLT